MAPGTPKKLAQAKCLLRFHGPTVKCNSTNSRKTTEAPDLSSLATSSLTDENRTLVILNLGTKNFEAKSPTRWAPTNHLEVGLWLHLKGFCFYPSYPFFRPSMTCSARLVKLHAHLFFVFPRSHGWRKFDSTYKIETSTDGSIGSIILNQSSGIFWILLFSWAMWDPISSAFCSSKFSRRCFKLLTFTHSISLGSEGILCHAWEQGFPASRLRILQMLVSSSHQMGDWLVAKRRFAGLRLAKNTNFATAWPTECQASCLWQASGMAYGSL